MEASLLRHDGLNQWPLVIESMAGPLSFPGVCVGAGEGLEVPTL